MFVAIALVFPVLLLLATLGMERVERPLERSRVTHQVQRVLRAAPDGDTDTSPDVIEALVADGYRTALRQYWRRQPQRVATRQPHHPLTTHAIEPQAAELRSAPGEG